jgi:hypothetical protein
VPREDLEAVEEVIAMDMEGARRVDGLGAHGGAMILLRTVDREERT